MRSVISAVGALGLLGSLVLAEQPKAQPSNADQVPAIGENSFTEDQAKAWIEGAGYTHLGELTLGTDGVWRTSARLGEKPTLVRLDYQGNVTTQ